MRREPGRNYTLYGANSANTSHAGVRDRISSEWCVLVRIKLSLSATGVSVGQILQSEAGF